MKKYYLLLTTILLAVSTNAQIVNIPDPTLKAILVQASSFDQIASTETPVDNNSFGVVSTYNKIDVNFDGEIQVSEALAIKYLSFGSADITNLQGIEAFTNLQYLTCNVTSATTLNVSINTNLKGLKCQSGLLSSLDFGGAINLKYLYCDNNNLTSLDFTNNINLVYISCGNNPLTNLNVSGLQFLEGLDSDVANLTTINLTNLPALKGLNLGRNDFSTIDVTNLSNLRDLDIYQNNLSTINVSNNLLLESLSCGQNQLTSIDLTGLSNFIRLECPTNQISTINFTGTNITFLDCRNNLLTFLNFASFPNFYNLNCFNNQLTGLILKNNNTVPLANYLNFSANPNLTYICVDEQDITTVQNIANTYGAAFSNNCDINSYCDYNTNGTFYNVYGNNRYDFSNDGCDSSDINFSNLEYSIISGTASTTIISDETGNYSIPVFAGTHTIIPHLENPEYFNVTPTSKIVSFPAAGNDYNQNFCITANGEHNDLDITIIPISHARPGFQSIYKIKYKNKGNIVTDASISFNYDDTVMDFVSSSLAPNSQTSGNINWNSSLGTLYPFDTEGEITVIFNLNSPMDNPALNEGNVLNYSATITGDLDDEKPEDNTSILNQTVVNSFDPNDKTCLEGSILNPSLIGKYLHYMIRFENTGTYPAEKIIIKDIINTNKYDIYSLLITDTSHNCRTKISGNKVEFIFENINLPFDDANNDGYVVFKIKTKSTLTVGSQIDNNAKIYFDNNYPITTNTATSTFQVLGDTNYDFTNIFTLSPVPTKNNLTINNTQNIEVYSIHIYNLLGQIVQSILEPNSTIDVSSLKKGCYYLKLITKNGSYSSKFIKE
ncbi:MAG TPA: T9SS type A sorting domain-containing protein [Flavobacterium lutivivi]|nr:T9SS type A sorting domain-containing protein [Flavobacterium lutivivi]